MADSQAALQALTQERGTWEEERTQLQGQLAAAKKSLALAQSKLVLAKQRETQLKASLHGTSCRAGMQGTGLHGKGAYVWIGAWVCMCRHSGLLVP